MRQYSETERILINILKELKIQFQLADCNQTADGILLSYNVVKNELKKYNNSLVIKEIYSDQELD